MNIDRCIVVLDMHEQRFVCRSHVISLDMIQDVLNNQDVSKMKTLLRANELPIEHEARAQLWMLLSSGSTEMIGNDETFCMYATKFTSGE